MSGTDGVGTKLKVAFALNRHDTIGQDLVAMCVNDIITTGAQPLFFLDYFGTGKLDADTGASVVKGIADGCLLSGCALLGGETAELPGMYAEGEYDLAGFAVGVADKQNLLGPERVKPTDVLLGIASSGVHSNGYSLARRVIEGEMKKALSETHPDLDGTYGDVLLTPTKIYAKAVKELLSAVPTVHALCHITGGGIPENLPRVLPEGIRAVIDSSPAWPAIFRIIREGGPVELEEMRRTFNLGVGMIVVVSEQDADKALTALATAGEKAFRLGRLIASDGAPYVSYENDPEDRSREIPEENAEA